MTAPSSPLQSLGGHPAPPEVSAHLVLLLSLPAPAKEDLWSVLGACLKDQLGPPAEAAIDAFCKRYGADGWELSLGLKAARFLLREAARRAVGEEGFAQDLTVLGGAEGPALSALLAPLHKRAMNELRAEILRGALLDHSKLLLGVDWRIDVISTSHRGTRLSQPVTMMTLRLREGGQEERFTFQALPDVIAELRAACDAILGER